MKDHLTFDVVEDVHVAIAKEGAEDWKVYLINKSDNLLTNVLISSKGYGEIKGVKKETSVLRHHFEELAPNSYLTIEPILKDLFVLFNEYWVSYYIGNKIYDKKFVFTPGSFVDENMINIPIINLKGVLHN